MAEKGKLEPDVCPACNGAVECEKCGATCDACAPRDEPQTRRIGDFLYRTTSDGRALSVFKDGRRLEVVIAGESHAFAPLDAAAAEKLRDVLTRWLLLGRSRR
jgi:hypothetical protein